MCGIFGQVAKNVEDINRDKIVILGVLNETRGTDSCGITIDGEILWGSSVNDKKFRDFAKGAEIEPKVLPFVFGHTRKSSVGVINEHNAHPFGFGDNPKIEGYSFIGAHNGTIYNYEELAEEFHVDLIESGVNLTRRKIDSEILLESIYLSKNFKVLNLYNGGAALVFANTQTGKVYLFSGMSTKGYYSTAKEEVERPLHVWIVDDNNFYFSSEPEPLEVIGGLSSEIFQIKPNTVFEITDGNFKEAVEHSVVRKSNQIRETTTSRYSRNTRSASTNSTTKNTHVRTTESGLNILKNLTANQKRTWINRVSQLFEVPVYKGSHYFSNMLLHRNGHVVSGIFIHISQYGYFKIGDTFTEANRFVKQHNKSFFDLIGCEVVENVTGFNFSDYVSLFRDASGNVKDTLAIMQKDLHYFVEGYKLLTIVDYSQILKKNPNIYMRLAGKEHLKLESLSYMTSYPVYYKYKWIKEGKPFTGVVKGLSFEFTFTFEKGSIISVDEEFRSQLLHLERIQRKSTEIEAEVRKEIREKILACVDYSKQCVHVEVVENQTIDFEDFEDLRESERFNRCEMMALDYVHSEILKVFNKYSSDFKDPIKGARTVSELIDVIEGMLIDYHFEASDIIEYTDNKYLVEILELIKQ